MDSVVQQQTIDQIYVQMWTQALAYGSDDAQEVALYALRSHNHEVWGEGYGDEFHWMWRPPGKEIWCRIDPETSHRNLL